jgi:CBS domain-containing protein
MGEQDVNHDLDDQQLRSFMRAILEDLRALETMLDGHMLETDVRRIGAEQEMFLVEASGRPASVAPEVLAHLDPAWFTTELARFNLEANLVPRVFGGRCLRDLEEELGARVADAREAAAKVGAQIYLGGILPSLRQSDLTLDNMTPNPRYFALNNTLKQLRGGEFRTSLKGVDELSIQHDNVMLEACNTSFQIHFQVGPAEFAKLYNASQLVTAPVLAAAVNSPLLLGHRLWMETRIALFQQSVDARSQVHQARGQRPRVSFGDAWIKESILEIFREDIARFRVVLARGVDENPNDMLARGEIPPLDALRLHNGTVYRWNRPCYGISDGKPHLRIENRALPAGPSIADEVANSAFYFGLMVSLTEEYGDIRSLLPFEDAKSNFVGAARRGLDAQFTWVGEKTWSASDLILHHLLPLARQGLLARGIDSSDADRYLGIVQERVESRMTGARWQLLSLSKMGHRGTPDERMRALVSATVRRQEAAQPVSHWAMAELEESGGWKESYRQVGQFMITDLVTVRPHDLVDLAASLMDWERLRYIPVEDDHGQLVGVVSYRGLVKLVARGAMHGQSTETVAVHTIMKRDPLTVTSHTSTLDAIRLMRQARVGCLPVVDDGRLVGLVTEAELIHVASHLLEDYLASDLA